MGIITSSKKRAKKAAELGGNCSRLLGCIKSLKDIECDGEFSLQNSLEMAYDTLKHVPGHTSKEVCIMLSTGHFLSQMLHAVLVLLLFMFFVDINEF